MEYITKEAVAWKLLVNTEMKTSLCDIVYD